MRTTIPKRVRASADALAANGGALDERIDRIDVRGLPNEALRGDLANAARDWVEHGFGTFSALDALGDPVTIEQLPSSDGELRLQFGKSPTESTYYFLTPRALAVLLNDGEKAAKARRVLVAVEFASFATVRCNFESWDQMVPDLEFSEKAPLPIPRRIVRDQLAIVPLSIGPLLLIKAPEDTSSDVFLTWRAAVAPQLLLCLADEVWSQDAVTYVSITGPRRRKLAAALERFNAERDLRGVTEVAEWVFNSRIDAETRHTLFAYELAREWPGEKTFAEGFGEVAEGALEAAKTAFRMHVRDSSKETLKALQDLRKTLADDVSRIVTQTRELTSSIWRDLLVVAAAVLGRFTLLTNTASEDAAITDYILYGVIIYLAFSAIMTVSASASFMNIIQGTQAQWQTKLYGFVDPTDFKTLAKGPLDAAGKVYSRARNATILAYAVVIIALVVLAFQAPSAPAANPDAGNNLEVRQEAM